MTTDPRTKTEAIAQSLRQKMDALLADFANGKINRDQFHAVYEKYNAQLAMAEQVLNGSTNPFTAADDTQSTIAILDQHMGKPLGLTVYTRQGAQIEALGEFEVPPSRVRPLLEQIQGAPAGEQRVDKMSFNRWLLCLAGHYCVIVTLFKNEPSQAQIRDMLRLLTDFERANAQFLGGEAVDAGRLAYPFLAFIQRKLKR
jgi:hypothetical protein